MTAGEARTVGGRHDSPARVCAMSMRCLSVERLQAEQTSGNREWSIIRVINDNSVFLQKSSFVAKLRVRFS